MILYDYKMLDRKYLEIILQFLANYGKTEP